MGIGDSCMGWLCFMNCIRWEENRKLQFLSGWDFTSSYKGRIYYGTKQPESGFQSSGSGLSLWRPGAVVSVFQGRRAQVSLETLFQKHRHSFLCPIITTMTSIPRTSPLLSWWRLQKGSPLRHTSKSWYINKQWLWRTRGNISCIHTFEAWQPGDKLEDLGDVMGSGSSEVEHLPCRGEALCSVSNLEKQTCMRPIWG